MNLKKLDQSVFEGLPSEYRWAAVDWDGRGMVYTSKPECGYQGWICGNDWREVSINCEASNWKRSLIERQDVPTAADIDWSRQDVPEGATHYAIQDGVVTWLKDDYLFWNVWEDGAWAACGIPVAQPIPSKPESITDVARSIEAARVAEKSGNRCATCTANICSVIDDCYVQRAKEESARIEGQACMPFPDGDTRYFETSPVGQKHDASKPRHSLLPVGSVERVIDVLEFGATKYAPNNWQHVSDARTRYYDATMRHLSAWWQGEKYDAESGLHHLAHAACCILFLLWFERSAK